MARTKRRLVNPHALLGVIPMIAVAVGVFVIGIAYSITLSFTNSRLLPKFTTWVGFDNYERLWVSSRWLISVQNIWIYGSLLLLVTLVFGYLLAVFMDQRIRQEDTFRTIFLYPYAMSLIVTGVVWKWLMDPTLGLQTQIRNWGWESFEFAPLASTETAIYGVVVAGAWQGTGVTMAILLAGLRGVDAEIWKAARVDGIPNWQTYLFIILPMMKGALMTAFILQCVSIVRVYDLIVALTNGGPGIATEMPAKFVIDHITQRVNVSLGMAAAALMLAPILVLIGLRFYLEARRKRAILVASQAS